jgi:hypothetical protein
MFNTPNSIANSIPFPILKSLHECLDTTQPVVVRPTDVDVLALSCTWWRLRAEGHEDTKNGVIDTIFSQELYKHLLPSDRDMARNVREYYSKKIMMLKLHGREMSKFRIDLAQFLTEDGRRTSDELKGMIYRLPEFYSYDREVDHMLENVFSLDVSLERTKDAKRLLPVKALTRNTKYNKNRVFFLKDVESGACVGTAFETANKLLPLWEMIFDLGVPLTVRGSYTPSEHPFKHYALRDWKLLNSINIAGD